MNLKSLLESTPQARERRFKHRAVARVLQDQFPVLNDIQIEVLTEIIGESQTLDRQWRKLLADNPHLRGSDYNEGEQLSQGYQIKLGYEVGQKKLHM